MVSVKGSMITARVRYVREHGDETLLRSIRRELTPESQALLKGRILPHEWAPFSLFIELSEAIDRRLGRGDLELCRAMGRYSARVNLPTLYRIFLRLGSVPFVLHKGSRLWTVHYDSGQMAIEEGHRAAHLVVSDFGTPHRVHCLSVLGWCEGAIELTGAKVTEAREELCRTRGDAVCRFYARWT